MKNFLSSALIIFLLHCCCNHVFGQKNNLSTPNIFNYTTNNYSAGTHNWNIAPAHGRVFFANNNGLLEFNGYSWNLYPLPQKSIGRSLDVSNSGRIYFGGQDEIGYFFPDESGHLQFHSIKESIPLEHRTLEDVWDLVVLEETMFARSMNKIFIYNDDKVDVFDPLQTINFLSKLGDKVYFNLINEGIYEYSNREINFVEQTEFFVGASITDVMIIKDDFIVLTTNNGVFKRSESGFVPWNQQLNSFLSGQDIISVTKINDSQIAIGTALSGVLIVDDQGKPIYLLDKQSGLQNNNIASLQTDQAGNLWAGTYNGIDLILLNNNTSFIFPDGELEGGVYDIAIHDDKIYFGTNNGLFYCDWNSYYDPLNSKGFELVKNSSGQVWGLDTLGGELFMGHNNGAFQIKNNSAIKISPNPGYWRFIGFRNNSLMLAGSYEGISLFEKKNDNWNFVKKLEGFDESSRIIEKENEELIWVSHPYRGIFKINLSPDYRSLVVKKYTEDDGLPSLLRNHVFKIGGKPLFTGEHGVYKYNELYDRFEMDSIFNQFFTDDKTVIRLFEDQKQNVWYITEDDFGFFSIEDGLLEKRITKMSYPEFADIFVGGYENIHISDNGCIYLLSNNGVIDFHEDDTHKPITLSTRISKVVIDAEQDSVIFSGFYSSDSTVVFDQPENFQFNLAPHQNALHFEFFSSPFDVSSGIEFNPYLEGVDGTSEKWISTDHKEYTNLTPGEYTFSIKSRNKSGLESETSYFTFEILPPWYKSKTAIGIYGILTLIFLSSLVLIPSSKYKKKAKVLEVAHEKSQEEIIQLKNERLETAINFKNQQLASSTMHIVQKNEVINKVKAEVELLKKYIKDPDAERELRKLNSLLTDDERLDEDWENFAYHFDQVHTDFLRRIKEEFPNLSPKDQKLCAYLRMNLSTKDIAPLLNISIRGVEISRYRLRKKLELDSSVNLNEYMMNY